MPEPLVLLDDVTVRFGATTVLSGIDLEVRSGSVLGVAGRNGVGKTTLLGVIATLVPISDGSGSVLGAGLRTPAVQEVRPRIGWSGHEPALYDHLTLRENLHLTADLVGMDRTRADEALEQVGLAEAGHRLAIDSSNGMRRRTDLAALLMRRPDLVLLDEAHAGLDADADAIVDALVRITTRAGGGVVMVSHDAERLRSECDDLIVLDPEIG